MKNDDKNLQIAIASLENWLQGQKNNNRLFDAQFLNDLDRGLRYKQKEWKPEHIQNTYLKEFEVPQIVLFDILTNRFPLLKQGQLTAEKAYVSAASGASEICILDIGIGRGFQMFRLLDALQSDVQPRVVTLIGIEISKAALDFTEQQLNEKRKNYDFTLNVQLLNCDAETITLELIQRFLPASYDCILVNASLTLHHIQQKQKRIKLFEVIKNLKPTLMVLIEPDADTMNDDYTVRLLNAAVHFSSLYEYVNCLSLTPEEKRSLKTFFSNDFFDPVALPDEYRFERLQTSSEWTDMAKKVELSQVNIHAFSEPLSFEEFDTEMLESGSVNYAYKQTPLLSVMGFKN